MSYAKLRGRIVEKFRTQAAFADAFEMDRSVMNGKLNNRTQWKADEVVKACELLDIPLSDAHLYFFCKQSCDNATE